MTKLPDPSTGTLGRSTLGPGGTLPSAEAIYAAPGPSGVYMAAGMTSQGGAAMYMQQQQHQEMMVPTQTGTMGSAIPRESLLIPDVCPADELKSRYSVTLRGETDRDHVKARYRFWLVWLDVCSDIS